MAQNLFPILLQYCCRSLTIYLGVKYFKWFYKKPTFRFSIKIVFQSKTQLSIISKFQDKFFKISCWYIFLQTDRQTLFSRLIYESRSYSSNWQTRNIVKSNMNSGRIKSKCEDQGMSNKNKSLIPIIKSSISKFPKCVPTFMSIILLHLTWNQKPLNWFFFVHNSIFLTLKSNKFKAMICPVYNKISPKYMNPPLCSTSNLSLSQCTQSSSRHNLQHFFR